MADPMSTIVPVALFTGVAGVSFAAGVNGDAVVMAFSGALMFAFMGRGSRIPVRLGLMIAAWTFGYYAGIEIAKRSFWGIDTPPLPSFVAAFFCVAVFKALLAIFNEDGKTWIRKRLGLSKEEPE